MVVKNASLELKTVQITIKRWTVFILKGGGKIQCYRDCQQSQLSSLIMQDTTADKQKNPEPPPQTGEKHKFKTGYEKKTSTFKEKTRSLFSYRSPSKSRLKRNIAWKKSPKDFAKFMEKTSRFSGFLLDTLSSTLSSWYGRKWSPKWQGRTPRLKLQMLNAWWIMLFKVSQD